MIILVLYIAAVFAMCMTLSAVAKYAVEAKGMTVSGAMVAGILIVIMLVWIISFGVWIHDF